MELTKCFFFLLEDDSIVDEDEEEIMEEAKSATSAIEIPPVKAAPVLPANEPVAKAVAVATAKVDLFVNGKFFLFLYLRQEFF
jgi:hypothetical protein